MEYMTMKTELEEMLRTNVAERNSLMKSLADTDESDEAYGIIQDRLEKLRTDYRSTAQDYFQLLDLGQSKWAKFWKKISEKFEEIDPNVILKILGVGGLIMLMAHYEKSDEEPVIFRSKAFNFIPKTM